MFRFRKKKHPKFNQHFNEIQMWLNMPDSYDKFFKLDLHYHMLSHAMSKIKDRQASYGEYHPGAYSPISLADSFLNKSDFYRLKAVNYRSQEKIEEDNWLVATLDELMEGVGEEQNGVEAVHV